MKRNKRRRGFTIVEVMVGAVLLVALGGGILGLEYVLGKGQLASMEQFLTVNQSNFSVSGFSREIRTARSGDNGTYLLEIADSQEIVFYSDIDLDGKAERVSYYLDGTDLRKSVIEPTGNPVEYLAENSKDKIIAGDVRNGEDALFYYYNGDWPADSVNNPLSVPADLDEVRMVQIYLLINPTEDKPQLDYVLNTFSQIRTIKDNL
jgi:hypothetical protein